MDEKQLKDLLTRYIAGTCTETEREWVEQWYARGGLGRRADDGSFFPSAELHEDLAAIRATLPSPTVGLRRRRRWLPYAAAAAVALAITATLAIHQLDQRQEASASLTAVDILPGGHRATLTLADGRQIDLSEKQTGVIIGDRITYSDGAALAGGQGNLGHPQTGDQFVLTTPKGGTYTMRLPDGTDIWLNAASRVVYREGEASRLVELDGEAYFEVAPDKHRPFKVVARGQEVQVLGTRFNINSYADEPSVRTTLVDGSVKVIGNDVQQPVLLQPGEQAILEGTDRMIVQKVAANDVIAWKGGLFSFNNTGIESIMRQLSRWYDVEVVFDGEKPGIQLWGEVYRHVNASEALAILEFFDLHYRIEPMGNSKRIVIYNEPLTQ